MPSRVLGYSQGVFGAGIPITVVGLVLRRKNASGDDSLHVTGDHWRIEDNTVLETDAAWDDDGTMRPASPSQTAPDRHG